MRPRQLRHLLDVGKVKLALVGPVIGRKHVLLPGLAQETLDGDLARRQALGPRALVAVLFADPAAVDEDGRAVLAHERRDHHVAVLAVAHARADEHLLVVAQAAGGDDAAVVKVVDRGRVNVRRQREGVAHETVLKLGNEVRLPPQALDLPGAEGKGCDGDEGCKERAGVR